MFHRIIPNASSILYVWQEGENCISAAHSVCCFFGLKCRSLRPHRWCFQGRPAVSPYPPCPSGHHMRATAPIVSTRRGPPTSARAVPFRSEALAFWLSTAPSPSFGCRWRPSVKFATSPPSTAALVGHADPAGLQPGVHSSCAHMIRFSARALAVFFACSRSPFGLRVQ